LALLATAMQAPKIFVETRPAELIVFEGAPKADVAVSETPLVLSLSKDERVVRGSTSSRRAARYQTEERTLCTD